MLVFETVGPYVLPEMSMFVAATGDGAVMLDGNAPPLELVEE
jgi:hypothetical protein